MSVSKILRYLRQKRLERIEREIARLTRRVALLGRFYHDGGVMAYEIGMEITNNSSKLSALEVEKQQLESKLHQQTSG